MTTPTSPPYCPDCGEPLPGDSPQALCPACLMRQALASRTIVEGEVNRPAAPPPSPEEIADKFPQFEILECLGRGGMGVVYKARQKSLNRLVAIKILAPERERDARFAERFAREAELLAKLNHPHIVTIHDFGETGGLFYLVMEFVDGVNLRDLLRDGRLEPKQALAIVPPICDALQFAHDKGVVHRDIKPENLLLDRDGRIKIADFGIASLVGAEDGSAGTPPYMAPEQSGSSTAIDHRTDIYALGVVLYEMLTGERPQKDLVAPSKMVQIDVRLDEMVLRALEKSPGLRYQSAGEFRTVVETLQTPAAPAPAAGIPPSFPESPNQPGPFSRFGWLFLVMIPLGVLLGLGLGGLWLSLVPKKYEAQAVVQIIPTPGSFTGQATLVTWMEAAKSEAALQQVSERLHLVQSWNTSEQHVASTLRAIVSTGQIRGTDLIFIKVRFTDSKDCSAIANALVHVLQARTAELPTPSEQIVVHEEALTPEVPVSPNALLILPLSGAIGFLLSSLLALLLILFLGRRAAQTTPGRKSRRLWIVAALIAAIALAVIGKQQFFRNAIIPPAQEAPDIGKIEFLFQHPRSTSGMGPVKSLVFPVKSKGETDWMPQSGVAIPLMDGSKLLVKARVRVSREGTHATAFVSTSTNGRDWQPESIAITAGQRTGALDPMLTLDNGLQTTIRWLPGAIPPAAARPVWFFAMAGVVVLLLVVAGIIAMIRLFKSPTGAGKTFGIGCLILLMLGALLFVLPAAGLFFYRARAMPKAVHQGDAPGGALPVEADISNPALKSDSRSIAVTVQGAVARPGKHALRADATLLDALAAAGGWTDNAKLDEIFVNTADGQGAKHDLQDILAGHAPNPALSAGHNVFVARRKP